MLPLTAGAQSIGNLECIACLERWLERAKLGKTAYVAVVTSEGPLHAQTDWAGSQSCFFPAFYSFEIMKTQIQARLNSRLETPRETNNSADRVCYNMSMAPACFDFFAWLVIAEMTRRRSGAPAPLKVGFSMVDLPEEMKIHSELRQGMYDNVIEPGLAFVGAVKDPSCWDAQEIRQYTFAPIVDWAKAGEEVPLFKPDAESMVAVQKYLGDGPAPVTITLREADYYQYRNSNLTEWLKAAEWLESQGERVIFIRDTAKYDEEITGFEICPPAALDIGIRLALYEEAKANLFVSNGPWSLALFGSRPWLMFLEVNAMAPFVPETAQWWKQYHGIDPKIEEQMPWSKPDQRIVWKRDTFENIKAAWLELLPLIEAQKAAA